MVIKFKQWRSGLCGFYFIVNEFNSLIQPSNSYEHSNFTILFLVEIHMFLHLNYVHWKKKAWACSYPSHSFWVSFWYKKLWLRGVFCAWFASLGTAVVVSGCLASLFWDVFVSYQSSWCCRHYYPSSFWENRDEIVRYFLSYFIWRQLSSGCLLFHWSRS